MITVAPESLLLLVLVSYGLGLCSYHLALTGLARS